MTDELIKKAILYKKLRRNIKRRINFLFIAGLSMSIVLNFVLVMTLVNKMYDLSIMVICVYALHDIVHRRATNFAHTDFKMLQEEAEKIVEEEVGKLLPEQKDSEQEGE